MRRHLLWSAIALVLGGCAGLEPDAGPVNGSVSRAATDGAVDVTAGGSLATRDVAWGDVDGDGDLDLAVAVEAGPDLVMLSGPAGLTTAWTSPNVEDTTGVALGDLDGDGVLDLVTTGDDEPLRVYAGDGAGGFSQYWTDGRNNREGRDVALGDLDGDGDLDIVQAVTSGVDRTWMNGGTSFASGDNLSPNADSQGVAVGDVDGDGDVDVAVARLGGDSRVYTNVGGVLTSTWTDSIGDDARGVALGDLDGDGDLDLVLGRDGGNRLWMGDGAGGFVFGGTQPFANTWSVALGDHDGDGALELAAGNDAEDEVYAGDDLTGTAAWDSLTSTTTRAVAWGDADGDGAPELLAGEYGGALVQYANAGLRPFAAWSSASSPLASGGALGDADGDGDLDLFLAIDGFDALWANDGSGSYAPLSTSPFSEDSRDAAWGDVDGDGDLDVAVGLAGTGARVLLNDGAGGLSVGWSASGGCTGASVAFGDFDGDGALDLAVGCDGAANEVWLGDGAGSFASVWASASIDATTTVVWGDLNGDGHLDLFVGNRAEVNRAWLGDGATLTLAWSSTDTADTEDVALADVDGDGDLDAVVANDADPDQIWLNDGQGSFSLGWSASSPSTSRSVAAADLDGDGDVDLAFVHSAGPTHFVVNDGGVFFQMNAASVGVGRAALAGDVDGDGDQDIVTASAGSPVTVFLSGAGGTDRLPDGPTRAVIGHPTLPGAAPGGGPVITGSVIPVPFLLLDRESDPAASVRLEYSPIGATDWTLATTSGATTNLATSPAGVSHSLGWNVAADGVAGERVAVRLVVERQVPRRIGGPLQVGAFGATSTGWRIAPCTPTDADGDGSPCNVDCDDLVSTVFPGAAEVPDDGVDQNCDGNDTITCWIDGDGDGFGGLASVAEGDGDCDEATLAPVSGDCDDGDPSVSPDSVDVPDDGIDQDCSGTDSVTCQVDQDGDSFGGAGTLVAGDGDCLDAGEAPFADDCDDGAPSVYPGAPETCDGIDQDCDGDLVEGFADTNGDGQPNCFDDDDDGDGVVDGSDCGPLEPTVYPGAPEVCDGIDQDCDGDILETFADVNNNGVPDCIDSDFDGDGFANTDCNDNDATIYPGAPEVVGDGIDQDCNGADSVTCFVDLDGDGVGTSQFIATDGDCDDSAEASVSGDCDDANPAAYPGAPEVVGDGTDQDCNGADTILCLVDADGDGYGSSANVLAPDGDCDDAGEASVSGDCNDNAATVSPVGVEVPDDGIDQDCNGADTVTCFVDGDGDGVGGATTMLSADGDCTDPGESSSSADCDDTDGTVQPGANDVPDDGIDQDCNGVDAVTCQVDNDGDGAGGVGTVVGYDGDCTDPGEAPSAGDCNDASATTYPGAPEVCDGVDQDCDGDLVESFLDTDGDGSPDCFDEDDDGDGTPDSADCGPLNASIYPGAPETCDGIDQDCDGDLVESYVDSNGNGLPDCAEVDNDGDGYAADDCDDAAPGVYPGAPEIVDDGIDQDCNGADAVSCFLDADGDGVGSATTILAPDGECDDLGEAYGGGDCDDAAPMTFPGAPEVPGDGVDQDCSGSDAVNCYGDGDGDGYGGAETVLSLDSDCTDPGEAVLGDDCDDEDISVHPGASDVCDAIDQDCDGDLVESFLDADGDGLPDCAETTDEDDDGYIGNDCDDGDPTIHPGATEIPEDGIDQDCNGVDAVWCFPDTDEDGFGDADTAVVGISGACGEGLFPEGEDCDDTDGAVFPGAEEICNGIDDDCDGELAPGGDVDADGDGFVECEDCADDEPLVFPGAEEDCSDGVNTDCDEYVQDDVDPDCVGLIDSDGDGWCPDGVDLDGDGDCDSDGEELAAGEVGDCDDQDGLVYPGQEDACDGVDVDCVGLEDEVDGDGDGQWPCEGDCDDTRITVFLGAAEVCDEEGDQDCDGSENEDHDDPDCWPTRWRCSAGGSVAPSWLWLLVVWPVARRRRQGARRLGALGLLALGAVLLPATAVAAPDWKDTLGLVNRAVERGQCDEALDQVRLLREDHSDSQEVLSAHADAARCAGRAREAVGALRALRELGGGDDGTDVLILALQRSLAVLEVRADLSGVKTAPWVRLEIQDGDTPELIEGEEVGAGLWRFSDLPADTSLALVVAGEGIRRLKQVLRPLGPGELYRHQLAPEWGGFGMLTLARDLHGVEVLVEEGRQRVPLSDEPVQVTAGRVPIVIIGAGGTVQTFTDVPAGDAGAIFDPLPWLPGTLSLRQVPAGSRVRVVVEDPDGRPRARSFAIASGDGVLDTSTGLRVVERVAVDSLTGGEAGVFVIHPVLGNHVSSMLLAPGEENTVQVDWQGMDGVGALQARWEAWRLEKAEVRKRIYEPLVPAVVVNIAGTIGAGVLGGLAVQNRNEAEAFKAAGVRAAAEGDRQGLSEAWAGYQRAHETAEGFRVAAVVSGAAAGVGLGLTIGFVGRGVALHTSVDPWDPWENEPSQSP